MQASRLSQRPDAGASLEQQLRAQVDALDGVLAEVTRGIRSPTQYDALEGRTAAIAARLRSAFRTRFAG